MRISDWSSDVCSSDLGKRQIDVPKQRHKPNPKMQLKLLGASGNNLKDVDLTISSGLFTAITGVSGSGKSTLINDTLYALAANEINGASPKPAPYRSVRSEERRVGKEWGSTSKTR